MSDSMILFLKNIPGPGIKGKIVIIECDDWGGIRMPSKEVYLKMLKVGIPVDEYYFDQLDTLANLEDLEQLFEVLKSVRDKNGSPAIITPVVNVANPDFQKIKESGYTQYFYEPFTDTLQRYYANAEIFKKWKEGLNLGIFVPEFHGRDHISVQHWLQKLREGDEQLRYAFDNGFVSVPLKGIHPALNGFRAEFYFDKPDQTDFLKSSITEGVHLFTQLFGYIPRTFAPGNGIFHPLFEKTVADTGIKYLYVNHFGPVPDRKGNIKMKYYRVGKRTDSGLTYYTRNCVFEPSDPEYAGIALTLKQMEAAFRLGKPAIISSHRVNFVGGIDPANREKGLKDLKYLLTAILNKWPDIEFMSTGDFIKKSINKKNKEE
jgi:hypothetical protein